MTDYTKTVDFATKDGLSPGNALKKIKGTEINTEFANIVTHMATKLNSASPAMTGTATGASMTLTGTLTANLIDGGTY